MPDCIICSQETRIIHDKQYGQDYYYCPACELISLDEHKRISPKEERREYSFHQNSMENVGYVQRFRDFIKRAIHPHHAQIKTALDFGAGPEPVLAELLRQEGFQVSFYDKFFAPDQAPLSKKYDLITITEVLEHLPNPLKTLRSLKELLNKNGIIAIMTLFHSNNEEEFQQWWYRRDSTHISFYTHKTIRKLAEILDLQAQIVDAKNICVLSLIDAINPS
ncbi:MAG: class I SAM-dependent methyltransferase, partial [bacterium]